MYNVLVFPGGTEIGLEIRNALRACKDIRLFSAGLDVSNHAPFVFSNHFTVPAVSDLSWLDALNKVIVEQDIDYVFPAHDDVIVSLADNAENVKARIVSSPHRTCEITRSKSATNRLFADILPVPKLYDDVDAIEKYPVFAKPDKGQGSRDTHIVDSLEHLSVLLAKRAEYIVMEHLPGDEYTVDCFSDRERGLLYCRGRRRIRVRNGISMNSRMVQDNTFLDYANRISTRLLFHGAWFFQLKKDDNGVFKLMEIAPRIAGTMALNRVAGVNFPLLSIYEHERIPIEIMLNEADVEIDRALVNRYKHNIRYSVVYVDLDDTLVQYGAVNTELVRFLYQCINSSVKIILLTKHSADLEDTLREHRLTGMFDEVIHIEMSERKADYICKSDAILIDDSFSERKTTAEQLGISTFDCSMIEVLIDDRTPVVSKATIGECKL